MTWRPRERVGGVKCCAQQRGRARAGARGVLGLGRVRQGRRARVNTRGPRGRKLGLWPSHRRGVVFLWCFSCAWGGKSECEIFYRHNAHHCCLQIGHVILSHAYVYYSTASNAHYILERVSGVLL